MEHQSVAAVARLHPTTFVKFHKGFTALRSALQAKRDPNQVHC